MRFFAAIIGLTLAAVIGYEAFLFIPASGVLHPLTPKLVDQCKRVTVFPGTEDVTIDPGLNLAFISAEDRRANPRVQGGIYAMSLDPEASVRKVSPDTFGPFHTHGISLWRGSDGSRRLFAINHRDASSDAIEIFDVAADGALTHLETVVMPAGSTPNDLVAIGPRAFYVTDDHGYKTGPMATLETYFALPFSKVVYFDGTSWSTVAQGLKYANGINVSADGATIFVTEFAARDLRFYKRDAKSGALMLQKKVAVDFGPDNVEVARDGGLWVAGHDAVFAFLAHARDPKKISPSRVIRVNPETGDQATVFVDTTGVLNASSVGAVWDRTLIVGAVYDDHVMVCPLFDILFKTAPEYRAQIDDAAAPSRR